MKKIVLSALLCVMSANADIVYGPLGVEYGDISTANPKYLPDNITDYDMTYSKRGNYQVFVSFTGDDVNLNNVVDKKELFFGVAKDYYEKMAADIKASQILMSAGGNALQAAQATSNSLMVGGQMSMAGAGLGIVLAPIFNTLMNWKAEANRAPEYYHVLLLKDKSGKQTKMTSLFVTDTLNAYKAEEIKTLMIQKENEKGIK